MFFVALDLVAAVVALGGWQERLDDERWVVDPVLVRRVVARIARHHGVGVYIVARRLAYLKVRVQGDALLDDLRQALAELD